MIMTVCTPVKTNKNPNCSIKCNCCYNLNSNFESALRLGVVDWSKVLGVDLIPSVNMFMLIVITRTNTYNILQTICYSCVALSLLSYTE